MPPACRFSGVEGNAAAVRLDDDERPGLCLQEPPDRRAEGEQRDVLDPVSVMRRRERRPHGKGRTEELTIDLEALRLNVDSRLGLDGTDPVRALNDELDLGIARVVRPVARPESRDQQFLQDILFGQGPLEVREQGIPFQKG